MNAERPNNYESPTQQTIPDGVTPYEAVRNNERLVKVYTRLEEAATWIDSAQMYDAREFIDPDLQAYITKAETILDEAYDQIEEGKDEIPVILKKKYNDLRSRFYALPKQDANAYYDTYVKDVSMMCQQVEKTYGIPHVITLVQSIIESGYGSKEIATSQNNYFGMTNPNTGDHRSYGSKEESFKDYGRNMTEYEGYSPAFAYAAKVAGEKL